MGLLAAVSIVVVVVVVALVVLCLQHTWSCQIPNAVVSGGSSWSVGFDQIDDVGFVSALPLACSRSLVS